MRESMALTLRTWVIAGALYIVITGIIYVILGYDTRPDWVATLSTLVKYALVVGIPAASYPRTRDGQFLVGYLLAIIPVPLLLLVLSVWLWVDRNVAGVTITVRVLEWFAVLVCVAAAVWFLPTRRRPVLKPYQ